MEKPESATGNVTGNAAGNAAGNVTRNANGSTAPSTAATAHWTGLLTTAAATQALARRVGQLIPCGGIVALTGPLGAGKTTFAQGLLAGLGVDEPVTSPTFTLMHRYQGRCPACHLDLYRLEPATGLTHLLPELEETIDGNTVLVIEWAERLGDWLPADRLTVELSYPPASAAGPATPHAGTSGGGHTAGHPLGHTAGHPLGHTAGRPPGHTAGHPLGHTAGHPLGHSAGRRITLTADGPQHRPLVAAMATMAAELLGR